MGKMQKAFMDYKSGRVLEGLYIAMPLEMMKRLAGGMTVEGKVGPKEFKLLLAHQDIFRAFIKQFDAPKL
jgi:hypothetical protein